MEHDKIKKIFAALGTTSYPPNGILEETGFPNFILLEDNSYILLE